MKKKIILGSIILIATFIIGSTIIKSLASENVNQYKFAEITKGNLESTISSSGTLSPVTTVEVGPQVSGTIAQIFADYNDKVKKGQLLAVLDTVLLKASVLDAQASLERSQAELEKAESDFNRNKLLFERRIISESEYLPYEFNLKSQKANIKSAQANLQRAEQNLKYAVIRSPINGTVISRSVEEGQTVAASLQAPVLFEIAEDLSKMEILTEVDESDIGLIKEGQTVRFDVQAYSDKIFEGTVRQIRMQPEVISNVVTYTVVVDAANDEGLLLPGMTATVDFIIEEMNDVLLVPNTALRFQATEEMFAEFRKKKQNEFESKKDFDKERGSRIGRNGSADNVKMIWFVDSDGSLNMEPINTGMTDGINTEIVKSRFMEEGIQVVTGTETDASANDDSKKTFMGPPGRGRGF